MEDYDKGIHPHAIQLISPYEELDCESINKRISEEANKYEEMVELLSNRLGDIASRSEAVSRLLTDQQHSMTSLNKINDQVNDMPVNSLSSADVDKLLSDLQVCVCVCLSVCLSVCACSVYLCVCIVVFLCIYCSIIIIVVFLCIYCSIIIIVVFLCIYCSIIIICASSTMIT